ncbi:MAG: S9 family peptidase [Sulfolobaceae archaeon]|nr:S9 family peptidase [Sulfolobaceae archaeon]
MEYSELVKTLERLVSSPIYAVLGKLKEENVIFFSTNEGETNISAIINGRVVRLTKEPIAGASNPKPNLDFIPFTRDVEKGKEIHAVYAVNLKGEEYEIASPSVRIFGLGYDEKNIAFVGISQTEASLYVIENGKLSKLISNFYPFSFVTDVSDGYIIGFGNLKGNPKSQEIFIADLSGNLNVLTPKEGSSNIAYLIKDKKVYFISDYENLGESYWVYTYDIEAGTYKKIEFPEKDIYEFKPVELSYDPEDSLIIAKREGESRLFINGKLVSSPRGTITGATRVKDEIYFAHSSLTSPYKIYKMNRDGKLEVVVRSEFNEDFGDVEYVKLKSDDNVEVPTWVVKSKKGRETKVAVVYVHGGPWGEVDNSWNLFIAPLVYLGYHVVAPNFRGSTGYGSKFQLMDIGDPGGGDLRDVVKARDYATKLGEKVGIMGYSYGGYMTLLALGKEADKWDFGIAGAAVADWVEMYELSDSAFKNFIEILFAGKNLESMRDRSPITYVNNVKAPLCIIQSQNDTRTPLQPVLRYIQELHKAGKTFEAHIIPNMGHAIYKITDAIDILLPAILFLKKLYG